MIRRFSQRQSWRGLVGRRSSAAASWFRHCSSNGNNQQRPPPRVSFDENPMQFVPQQLNQGENALAALLRAETAGQVSSPSPSFESFANMALSGAKSFGFPRTIGIIRFLAAERMHEGQLGHALAIQDASVTFTRAALEEATSAESPDTKHVDLVTSELARSLNLVGMCRQKMRKYDLALRDHTEAVEILRKLHKFQDHEDIAITLSNIAAAHQQQLRFEPAVAKLEESLAMANRLNQDGVHPSIGNATNNLAHIYFQKGNPAKALENHTKAYEILLKCNNGKENEDTAAILFNVGSVLFALKQPDEAIVKLEACRKTLVDIFGEGATHPQLVTTLRQIAGVQALRGEHKVAIERSDEAIALLLKMGISRQREEATRGSQEQSPTPFQLPDLALCYDTLATSLALDGQLDRALTAHEECVACWKQVAQTRNVPVELSLCLLRAGHCAMKSGKLLDKAKAWLDECLAIRKTAHGTRDHRDMVDALEGVGMVRVSLGDREGAQQPLQEARAMRGRLGLKPLAEEHNVEKKK